MKILTGQELYDAVNDLFVPDKQVRCAVAFWGPYWARRAYDCKAEVILDISMGGTSKNAIRALLGMQPDQDFREDNTKMVLDRLHAKIFLGDEYAIVGSANASIRAVGNAGVEPFYHEAAVLIDSKRDQEAYRQVQEVYENYKATARPLGESDLCRAPRASSSKVSQDFIVSDRNPQSLFQAVQNEPDRFKWTSFIFADADFEEGDENSIEDGLDDGDIREAICSENAGSDNDQALGQSKEIVFFWFGYRKKMIAYQNIMQVSYGDGMVGYVGSQCDEVGSPPYDVSQAWQVDRNKAEEILNLKDGQKGERLVVMAADELAEWLENYADRA